MAEIHMDREGAATPHSDLHRRENLGDAPGSRLPDGHALPGGTPTTRTDPAAVVAGDPQAVRAEIEQTRERMSETIGEIEGVLARKREKLQDRLDVMSPVRERPLAATGIAFGAGLVLGLLTGGDDPDDGDRHASHDAGALGLSMAAGVGMDSDPHLHEDAGERAAMWEARARRLLKVARAQEEQIRELEERYGLLYSRDAEAHGWEDDDKAAHELTSSIGSLRDTVLHGLTGFLTDAFHQMGKGGSGSTSQA